MKPATEASTWIQEDGDVPIDFMSADAAHSAGAAGTGASEDLERGCCRPRSDLESFWILGAFLEMKEGLVGRNWEMPPCLKV